MKTPRKFMLALLIASPAMGILGGYAAGQHNKEAAVQSERQRVTSAIARTMRCSSEEEFDRGEDHQCESWEIEQDAGLK